MKSMLREGGDTDTNAAIVGGLIGAYVGYDKIPQSYKDAILKYDCETMIGNKVENYLLPKYHLCSKLV
jgi:ADP-ribosyl-[dinitrogen reductase] hydrolase